MQIIIIRYILSRRKKVLIIKKIILACLLLALFTACGNGQRGHNPSSQQSAGAVDMSQPGQGSVMPPVADAAQYRGTVDSIVPQDGMTTVQLSQAEGTNFGSDILTVLFDANTSLGFDLSELELGDYVEVYYGASIGQPTADTVTAIQADKLGLADLVLYNGTVVSMVPDPEKEGYGDLTVKSLTKEGEIVFHYTSETLIHQDEGEIKEGARVCVYFSGATTRSIPPQATAWEVWPYYEG